MTSLSDLSPSTTETVARSGTTDLSTQSLNKCLLCYLRCSVWQFYGRLHCLLTAHLSFAKSHRSLLWDGRTRTCFNASLGTSHWCGHFKPGCCHPLPFTVCSESRCRDQYGTFCPFAEPPKSMEAAVRSSARPPTSGCLHSPGTRL